MKFHLLKAVAIAGAVGLAIPTMAQSIHSGVTQQTNLEDNGGFSINLRSQKISQQQLEKALPGMLGLSAQNELKKVKSDVDKFGNVHVSYQQYFKDIPVQDAVVLMHLKDGMVTSVNGVVLPIPDELPIPTNLIPTESAISVAEKAMAVTQLLHSFQPQLVMMKNKVGESSAYVVAWNVRINGKNKDGLLKMDRVFINAQTGSLINTFPLIYDASVTGSAETLYRGQRQVVSDSVNPTTFVLRDSVRKIYTFDASGVDASSGWGATSPFDEDVDFVNHAANWGELKTLQSFRVDSLYNNSFINGVGQSSVLIAAVGHGQVSTIDDINPLTMNILYSAFTLPIKVNGLYIPVKDDSLYGAMAKINFSGDALDSFAFRFADSTLGIHLWSDTLGNKGKYSIEEAKNPALDAHWGMEETHDFYNQEFGRNSYDGHGAEVRNYINGTFATMGTQTNAAALSYYGSMVYGMGDGESMGPVVGLDVMGHEFTHMVTDNNGNGGLNYQDQSGALNESISDMMGTAIEFFADSANATWTIGDGVVLTSPYYMRSMSEPNGPGFASGFQRQPDTYLGQYWYTGNQDNGGVHINSGVPNKWFYLLSVGGSGTNDNSYHYQVTGQGIDKAQQIVYQALTQYITPTATFVDAYNATLNAAQDIYGANSSEYDAVKAAWLAVGVPYNDTTQAIGSVAGQNSFVTIYPNPATTQFTLTSSWNQPFELNIYSVTGARIRTIKMKPGQNTVAIADLSKGTYFLKYEIGQQVYGEKLSVL